MEILIWYCYKKALYQSDCIVSSQCVKEPTKWLKAYLTLEVWEVSPATMRRQ